MALVTCPECNRENVSNTAEACPYCGFAIKEYFITEEKNRLLKEKRQAEEQRIEEELEKLKPELEQCLDEINEIEIHEPPSFTQYLFSEKYSARWWGAIICLIIGIMCASNPEGALLSGLLIFVALMLTGYTFASVFTDREYDMEEYKKLTSDIDSYREKQKAKVYEEYETYAQNLAKYGQRTAPDSVTPEPKKQSTPKCPTCGSENVSKINALERGGSILLLGLFSGKLGKNMKCKDCGYKW